MNNLLKSLRAKKGYTQEQMAQILGYSNKSSYCMLENGHVKMTLEQARKIAEALDIDPVIFFEEEVQETSTNNQETA